VDCAGINDHWAVVLAGVMLWGVHMGITQGLLATMVADTAPADLRGTAYGVFNLVAALPCWSLASWRDCFGISLALRPRSMPVPPSA
jgi:hypothetical protein